MDLPRYPGMGYVVYHDSGSCSSYSLQQGISFNSLGFGKVIKLM